MKELFVIILILLTICGCAIYPMKIIEPIDTRVVDASTGKQLDNVNYLRIVCDIHNFKCKHGVIDKGIATDGNILLDGKRQWGFWFPAPGGLPVPNHQIAVWKEGYYAFIFSQYGKNIDEFACRVDREDIRSAVDQIPKDGTYLNEDKKPEEVFLDGVIELIPLNKAN